MIHVALLVALMSTADTSRCTWEGRLPERVQRAAVISRPEEVARLTAIYRRGTKNERMQAVEDLGALGDPRAVPLLGDALSDSSKHVVQQALWALGRMNDPRVVPILLSSTKLSDPQLQQAAVCGIGRTADQSVLPTLRALLESHNVFVASAATWAIKAVSRQGGS